MDLARRAGKAILEVYACRFEVRYKGPDDPVTDAALRAQDIIVEGLAREFPDDGIISEECPVSEEAGRKSRVWYVDPLDGTGEFVARSVEFSVIIGLVEGGCRNSVRFTDRRRICCTSACSTKQLGSSQAATGNRPGSLQ